MCLAADVPLIESGTAGFNGQVQVIKKVYFVDASPWVTTLIGNDWFRE